MATTNAKTPTFAKQKHPSQKNERLKINSPLSVLQTLLLSPDPQDIIMLQRFAQNKEGTHAGKFAKVYIARETENTPLRAIKQQAIQTPKNKEDTAFRELRIYQHLVKLGLPNFIEIVDYAKCHDAPSIFSPEGKPLPQKVTYMHYILEYAEKMLLDVKEVTVEELRSILFQLIYTLCIAQERCQFVHGDLHFKNILVKKNTTPIDYKYRTQSGEELSFRITGDVVKLCDFGLSRIRLDNGEILYNDKAPLKDYFDPTLDITQIARDIGKLKVTNWDAYPLEEKLHFSMLKRMMVKGEPAGKLLQQDFFVPLRTSADAPARAIEAVPKVIITDPDDLSHESTEDADAVAPLRGAPRKAHTAQKTKRSISENLPPTKLKRAPAAKRTKRGEVVPTQLPRSPRVRAPPKKIVDSPPATAVTTRSGKRLRRL